MFWDYAMLVTLYKEGEVYSRLLGTNGFHVKAKNERFTAVGWRCVFFVKNDLQYFIRDDLTDSKNEYEALWIEIEGKGKQNILYGVVYRHPNGSLSMFQDYLNLVLDKIRRQNKQCLIMGDFNLDLIKYETHADNTTI